MIRLCLALVVVGALGTPGYASLTSREARRLPVPVDVEMKRQVVSEPQPAYQITADTEVLLDGRACRYDQVPQGSVITNLEVTADKKHIFRIHFRSGK